VQQSCLIATCKRSEKCERF